MIRALAARLFGHDLAAPCGVADFPVGGPDLGCRDQADTPVQFHCDGCGPRTLTVCTHHAAVIQRDPNVGCKTCIDAGWPSGHITFHTTPAGAQ